MSDIGRAVHMAIHLHRNLKQSLWPCLELSFREMRDAGTKKTPKGFFCMYLCFPASTEEYFSSIPRVLSTVSLFACLHHVTARFLKLLGLFPACTMLGWQQRAWGKTQPEAQPGAAAFPSQVVAQCGKCVLLSLPVNQ